MRGARPLTRTTKLTVTLTIGDVLCKVQAVIAFVAVPTPVNVVGTAIPAALLAQIFWMPAPSPFAPYADVQRVYVPRTNVDAEIVPTFSTQAQILHVLIMQNVPACTTCGRTMASALQTGIFRACLLCRHNAFGARFLSGICNVHGLITKYF